MLTVVSIQANMTLHFDSRLGFMPSSVSLTGVGGGEFWQIVYFLFWSRWSRVVAKDLLSYLVTYASFNPIQDFKDLVGINGTCIRDRTECSDV